MLTGLFSRGAAAVRRRARLAWLLALPLLPAAARAQIVATQPVSAYTFVASSGTYTPLTAQNGTVQDIVQNDNISRVLPIGFDFPFEGGRVSTFTASSKGWLSFGAVPSINSVNNLAPGAAFIAPLWGNLSGTNASASYVTLGTAPNRVFTMQWSGWYWPELPATPPADLSFQVKLYETTGVIQFIYRQEPGTPRGQRAATIGLSGLSSILSLSDASAAPTVSTSVSTNTISQRPATGQIYTFTPPAPCPGVSSVTATATSATTASVSFVAGGGNPTGYRVRYFESSNPATAQTVTAPAAPALLTGLRPSTAYTVEVFSQCSSGSSSFPTTGQFSTPAPPNATATWTGASSSDWAVGANWSSGTVPTLTTDVTIPATATQPVVTGAQQCGALSLQAGATLTLTTATPATTLATSGTVLLASGSTLVQGARTALAVGQDLTNNGATLNLASSSTVTFTNAAEPQTLNGTAATTLQNLVLGEQNAGIELHLAAPVSVQYLLKCVQASFIDVDAGGALTLLYQAQHVRDNTSFVNGNVTVERLLRASDSGRGFFAASVRQATLSQLAAPGFTPVVNAAYNTSPTPGSVTPFPTVFGYDQSNISTNVDALTDFERGFYSPAALTEPLGQGLGYRLDAPATTILRLTGPLNNGSVTRGGLTRATLPQSGYHLLGNPYPAALDWDVLAAASTTTGLDGAVYTYSPAGPGVGMYQSYVNGVGGPRYLLPGQAFFVRVSADRKSVV